MADENQGNAFLARLAGLEYEPTRVQGLVVDMLEKSLGNGIAINDPGTPAMKLLEMAVMLSTAAIRNDEVLERKSYPYIALDENDLFSHMSDKDYLDMFATPGDSVFKLYFSRSEVVSRSVTVGNSTVRKLTIPKHTRIVAGGVPFTMQYPIDFLVKRNGALDVVFDLSKESPLQHLSTNKVDWRVIRVNGVNDESGAMDILEIDVPVKQMMLTSYYTTVSSATVLKKKVSFNNKFCAARAYIRNSQGDWNEFRTTHHEQTFDVLHPTLLLKVADGELIYELPYVYLLGNLTGREIRVDVYTTNGKYDANLEELDSKQLSVEFIDLDNDNKGTYTSPITLLDTRDVRNMGYTSGGRDAPSFRNRREAVINNNIGEIKLPVTGGQLDTAIKRLGFDSALAIDDITRRTYIASRKYPGMTGNESVSIDSGVVTIRTNFESLVSHPKVYDNGTAVTLSPDILYRKGLDGLSIVDPVELAGLSNLDNDTLVNRLNQSGYLWSPFHYVLDIEDNKFKSSAYQMTNPFVEHTSYLASNEESGLLVMAGSSRTVEYKENGYKITIVADGSSAFRDIADKDIAVQLMINDRSVYGYMNGTIVGRNESDQLILEFFVGSHWDMKEDTIDLSGFTTKNGSTLYAQAPLDPKFELIWSAKSGATDDVIPGSLDSLVGSHLLDGLYVGIYHEVLAVRLGYRLNLLWTGARMVAGDRAPKRYSEDVYLKYGPRDMSRYQMDPVTGLPVVTVVKGKNTLVVLHGVGDIVKDPVTGEPIILHHKNNVIISDKGEIEYESDRSTRWWADLTLFDARFKFANTDEIKSYVKYISNLSVSWSNRILDDLNKTALERTKVFYSPKNSIDDVSVLADDGAELRIKPEQSLTVNLFVLKGVFQDYSLRSSVEKTVSEDVFEAVAQESISISSLEENIMKAMPDGVVGIQITGLGGNKNYSTITVIDGRNRLSIGKELFVDLDNKLGIKNNIRIVFRLHGTL